jgi:hypothetical protein
MIVPVTSDFPQDPFELSAEELEERLADVSHPVTRQLLEAMWRSGPQAQLNVRALFEMANAGVLYTAIQLLTEQELRTALYLTLTEVHQMQMTPEQFQEWSVPRELWPDDYEPPAA